MSSLWTARRSTADAKLAGLCGGLAQLWGVDAVLIRVGFAVLALCGGIGLVLYLAGWLLVPVEGKRPPLHDVLGEPARRWPREVWIAVVVVCCVVTFNLLSPVTPFGFSPAVVLALIWYFGYYRHRSPQGGRTSGPASLPGGGYDRVAAPGGFPGADGRPAPPLQFFRYPGPPTPFTQAADAWRQRVEDAQRSVDRAAPQPHAQDLPTAPPAEDLREPVGPADSLPPARPLGAESVAYSAYLASPDPAGIYSEQPSVTPPPAAPVKRYATRSAKRLRLLALVAVGLTLSGLGAASSLGARVPVPVYLASALLILGLTLIAATWWGRARGILPVALLLMLATVGSTVTATVAPHQGWGTQQVRYTTPAELARGDSQGVGQLRVDLTGLTATADTRYTAHVGMGDLEVSTPSTVNVVVNWRVKSGALLLDGKQTQGGSNQSGQVRPTTMDPRKKTLTLDLSVDRGVVEVQR